MKKLVTTAKPSRRADQAVEIPNLGPGFFANAVQVSPENLFSALGAGTTKQQITIRIDKDVVEFFKRQGKGYQRLMNFALRAYMPGRMLLMRPPKEKQREPGSAAPDYKRCENQHKVFPHVRQPGHVSR